MKSYFQVKDRRRSIVRRRLEELDKKLTNTREEFKAPVRDKECVTYRRGRQCMKPLNEVKKRKLIGVGREQLLGLVRILLDLKKNRYITKRAIFYKNTELFGNQTVSDELVEDLCCIIGTTRRSLGVKATPNGFAAGSLIIKENGQLINFEQRRFVGVPLSTYLPKFEVVSCNARFILVVEKEATFSNLIDENFLRKVGCVLITGCGMPDVGTRFFLQHLSKQLKHIPVLALMDSDPSGIQILMTYLCGSDALAFDSKNLATPNIKWLGLRPSELEKTDMHTTEFKKYDRDLLSRLLERDYFSDKAEWMEELEIMKRNERSCAIGVLSPSEILRKIYKQEWL